MSVPKTMFQLSGRGYAPANLAHATLVIIDAQKEYLSGPLALIGIDDDKGRMAQDGCCITAAAELKHRFWNGHSGCLLYTSPSPRDS